MKVKITSSVSLLDHLLNEFGTASKTTVKQRIAHGNVRVNGKLVTNPATVLKEGDSVEYVKQAVKINKVKPPYQVIFEDDAILVAVKPA